uniref:ATP synthase F0 subunit 8 n=1 Tax=Solemya velesiana TaxID=395966 RepID=A0A1W5WVD7_9BIVA|nr:ATP synthase F0 subunit 8 [Solemya velesiana]ARH10778.1 ATP synthase F0 subunit 8 [Solemya velesiana]
MPQLSPLNWLFLFFVFWCVIFLMMCVVWWSTGQHYDMKSEFKSEKISSRMFNWK